MNRGFLPCKRTRRDIPRFLKDDMDILGLSDFVSHISVCNECRDELEINYLVKEGIHRLEAGENFDIKGELEKKIMRSKRSVFFYTRGRIALVVSVICVMIVIAAFTMGLIVL